MIGFILEGKRFYLLLISHSEYLGRSFDCSVIYNVELTQDIKFTENKLLFFFSRVNYSWWFCFNPKRTANAESYNMLLLQMPLSRTHCKSI